MITPEIIFIIQDNCHWHGYTSSTNNEEKKTEAREREKFNSSLFKRSALIFLFN